MISKKESILNEKSKKKLLLIILKNIKDNFYNSFHNRLKNIKAHIYRLDNVYKKKDIFINHQLENRIWEENRFCLKSYHKLEKQNFWFYFKLVFFFIFYTILLLVILINFFLKNLNKFNFYKETLVIKNTIFLNLISDSFLFLVSGGFLTISFYIAYDFILLLLIFLKFLSDFNFIELKKNLKTYIFIDSYFIRTIFLNVRVFILFFILFYIHYLLIGQNSLIIDANLIVNYIFNYTYFILSEVFISLELNTYFTEPTYSKLVLYINNIILVLLFIKKSIIISLLMTIRLFCFLLSIYWVCKILIIATNG